MTLQTVLPYPGNPCFGRCFAMLDLPLWLVALGGALLASTVTTITSIGAGMIMYGALSLFLDLKVVIPLVAPAQLLAVGLRCWLFRRHLQLRLAALFFLGVVPGIYAGTLLFDILTETALRRIIGIFLLAFAAYEMWRGNEGRTVPHAGFLPLGGAVAGIFLGSIGIAGPLLAVIFLRYGLLKEDLIAMVALFFLLGNAQRTVLYWQQGFFVEDRLALAAAMGLAMLGGVYIGRLVLPHISQEFFRRLVLGMLVLFGVQFLVW
jgi:uncharacterized membrane protein YfcA